MGLNKTQNTKNAIYCFQGKMIRSANKSETTIEKNGKFYEPYDSVSGIIMPNNRSVDIDYVEDFNYAETLMRKK